MTDFFSLSPPRSVYTAIPDGDLSLWQSLTAVNSKQCCYELCTRASVGSDASSVFKAFRNLQALSHSVQGSTLSPSIATHIHTYIQGQPNNMGPSQNQSHCLPSAAHPGSTRKGQHWVQEGKSRNLHPATSCGQAPWPHSDRCSPLVLRAPGRLLTAGTGEGTDPRSEVGVNVRTSSDFCRHPPTHTHTRTSIKEEASDEGYFGAHNCCNTEVWWQWHEFNGANFWNGNKGLWETGKTMGKVTILQTFKYSE